MQDAAKELADKRMALGDDPKGGIDLISAASARHGTDEDNKTIKRIFMGYSTGAKNDEGLPNGEKIIEKWNAQLAA